jgi:hypothetical protein
MAIVPIVMNVLQFLIVDSILKARGVSAAFELLPSDEESARDPEDADGLEDDAPKAVVSKDTDAGRPPMISRNTN